MARVVLTDHPWASLETERRIIEGAGHQLFAGPMEAPDAAAVEAMIAEANPHAILTCWAQVNAAAIAAPAELAIVARIGVGLDNIDVPAATARGAFVTNVPDYCVSEVSDHAIALILAHVRGIASLDRAVKAQGWHVPAYLPPRLGELTIGIVGYGRIGRATARKLHALGCEVLACDPGNPRLDEGIHGATLADIQQRAHVIVLHMPLLPETTGIVNRAFIESCRMRPFLVNVSRGGLVDNEALIWGLDQGLLRGAGLDVVDGEPAPPRALLDHPDVIVTPHIAYSSDASLAELRRRACEEVVRVLNGDPPEQPCNTPERIPAGVALPGGVSSDIRVVDGAHGPEVVKRALGKLKVAADWFSDPARSATEVRALEAARELLGTAAIPEVLWSKPDANCFAMSRVDPRFRNWKQDLLAGRVELNTAQAVGNLLGRLHGASAVAPDIAVAFDDRTYFRELRVQPFFETVAEKLPDVSAAILATAAAMGERRSALVHGDFSPKNLLVDGEDVVLLDWEVAHWGDPSFDIGFMLAHLWLKAMRPGASPQALLGAARAFLRGYAEHGSADVEDVHLSRMTACLILARIVGTSPVDYLDAVSADAAGRVARSMLGQPGSSVGLHLADFDRALV